MLQGSCPRVADSIDTMTHSHDASTSLELRSQPRSSMRRMTDGVEHVESLRGIHDKKQHSAKQRKVAFAHDSLMMEFVSGNVEGQPSH